MWVTDETGIVMGKALRLCGQKFGRLSVGPRGPNSTSGKARWICKCDCGKYTLSSSGDLASGEAKSCGCVRRYHSGSQHPQWRGGRTRHLNGYILLLEPGHLNAFKRGYVFEHVKVMGGLLDRPLTKGETVHHKNGIRDDNRPENLELWASRHGPGQRVSDLAVYAKEILQKYDPQPLASNVGYTPVFGRPPLYASGNS